MIATREDQALAEAAGAAFVAEVVDQVLARVPEGLSPKLVEANLGLWVIQVALLALCERRGFTPALFHGAGMGLGCVIGQQPEAVRKALMAALAGGLAQGDMQSRRAFTDRGGE